MFADQALTETWSGFLLLALCLSLACAPAYYAARRARTVCPRCNAGWSLSKGRSEAHRSHPLKRGSDTVVEESWQYWTCTACGHETRRLVREHNTEKVSF